MAVAKKATKKAVKKTPAKKPVKKTATKKAAAVKSQHQVILEAARIINAHDLVNRNELRIGDAFLTNDHYGQPDFGVSHNWGSIGGGEQVIFQGINEDGLLVVSLNSAILRLPVEAVDFSEITEAGDLDHEEEVVLNNNHTARVERGYTEVAVGCQRIHIDRVREVVAAYDRVQGDGPVAQNRTTTLTTDGTYAELLYVAK